MTHTKDQDRAEFLAWVRTHEECHGAIDEGSAWVAWQASRSAQVVPQFSPVAQTKLKYLLEAGEAITGYAIENKDGRRGAIDCHGFVYWWNDAAAPQPPEVVEECQSCRTGSPYACTCPFKTDRNSDPSCFEAAPVQMPEPAAYLHECGKKPSLRTLEFSKVDIQLSAKGYKSIPLYTEHQVRQLLAQHGIK